VFCLQCILGKGRERESEKERKKEIKRIQKIIDISG
jgi:hypothetical protein